MDFLFLEVILIQSYTTTFVLEEIVERTAGWPVSWTRAIEGSSLPLLIWECSFYLPFLQTEPFSRTQPWERATYWHQLDHACDLTPLRPPYKLVTFWGGVQRSTRLAAAKASLLNKCPCLLICHLPIWSHLCLSSISHCPQSTQPVSNQQPPSHPSHTFPGLLLLPINESGVLYLLLMQKGWVFSGLICSSG